ncbi:MAG: rhombosortase [Gammaproteobacteria bacterium]|nr:rhombosortase [Gammaproteobacteria bacterium]
MPLLRQLKPYVVPLTVAALAILAQLGGDWLQQDLRYDREAIVYGEIWRLLTGNFLHLGIMHLLLNLAGLVLIWMFFGARFSHGQWIVIMLVTALATGLGLLEFNPEVGWYVGLSGALHGYFVAGCMAEIRLKLREGWWLLIVITLKLAWEQWHGAMPGTASLAGGEVIVDAHLYGAIAGLAAFLLKPRSPVNYRATAL